MDIERKEQINAKAKEHLIDYIEKVKPLFNEFFSEQKDFTKGFHEVALDMVTRYEAYLGGKRLRGALTKLGYDIFGGTQEKDILKVSTIIELIHGFALMHDDIYDQDDLRRGKPAMHKQFERVFDEKFPNSKRNRELYGISMATNLGDVGSYYSNLILCSTDFEPQIKLNFLKRLSQVVIQTVYGQALDITFELEEIPQEDKVLMIHRYKTALYTVSGPLQYGAVLAGISKDDSRYQAIEKYGLPIGTAFQLRDDYLGMFSTPEKFGKPVFSDLRQGKNTLLFSYAFANANPSQLADLKRLHGNPDVNDEDLKLINQILIDTGAVAYSDKMCEDLINEGKKYISDITTDPKYQDLLDTLADYVVTRNS